MLHLHRQEIGIPASLFGADEDADALLAPAMALAKKRVVVKRPDYAEPLNNQPAHASVTTKNHRFDIYPCI